MNEPERAFARKLVHEVKQRPILYDSTHPEYKDRSRIDSAWADVAETMHTSAGAVKRRWQNLRGSYSKFLSAVIQSSGSARKRHKFYLQKQMSFLLNHMAHGATISEVAESEVPQGDTVVKLEIEEEEEDDSFSQENKGSFSKEMESTFPRCPSSPCPSESEASSSSALPKKSRKRKREYSEVDWAMIKFLDSKTKKETNPDLEFLKGLLHLLADLDKRRKRQYFTDITQMLVKALNEQEDELSKAQL